jgi:hypothetical protein
MGFRQILEAPVRLYLLQRCSVALVREDAPHEPVEPLRWIELYAVGAGTGSADFADEPKKPAKWNFIAAISHFCRAM